METSKRLRATSNPSMRLIAQQVADEHGVSLSDLKGPSKFKRFVLPRQEAFCLIYRTGAFSLPQIGRFFGGRHHTTVLHGVRAHERRAAG